MVMITGKIYDVLKYVALIVLPALATMYVTLASIWGLGSVEAVVGTIVAIDTFLGVVLQLSSTAYNRSDAAFDGNMLVHTNDETGQKTVTLELNDDPKPMAQKKELRFKAVDVENVRKIMQEKKSKPRRKR